MVFMKNHPQTFKKPIFSLKTIKHIHKKTIFQQNPWKNVQKTKKTKKHKKQTMFWRSSAIPHHQAEDLQNIYFFVFWRFFIGFCRNIGFLNVFFTDFADILVYSMDFDETLAPEVGGQPVSPPTTSWLKTSRTLLFFVFWGFLKVFKWLWAFLWWNATANHSPSGT